MNLQQWDITFDSRVTPGLWGECDSDWRDKTANISIEPNLGIEDTKRAVIHELAHVMTDKLADTRYIRRYVSEKAYAIIEKTAMSRAEELVLQIEDIIYSILEGKER